MEAIQQFVQQVINGLVIGSVYSLIALGYTMVFGILGFINFAHGDVYMIGTFVGLVLLGTGAFNFGTALIGAAIITAIVGIGMKLNSKLREGRYVPFGPFLAGSGLAVLLIGAPRILGWLGWA